MITDFHAKYLAHELTKRCPPDSSERLAGAVASAQVDLNPHQVDAALFAFASPLSKGALLADEVGLGKTIEAGLVISQRWAERKRRILVIAPSNLRKQWHQELSEKFLLPGVILESKSYNQSIRDGALQPFEAQNAIVICSYQFARSKASDVHRVPWDLVVIDEAHRLRNVYKPSNVIANTLKNALAQKNKLLLTATPLQNSLLELYGLVSFIDEHAFGDVKSFREQFANPGDKRNFEALKERLKPICHRTLRRQVTAYIPYTRRLPLVEEFTPADGEDRLYQLVTEYLQRDNLQALPSGQRSLMTLVLRKLLASSTFAIAGALDSISQRLRAKLDTHPAGTPLDELTEDFEALEATAEEWPEDADEEPLTDADREAIEAEIADLESFAKLATSIEHNAKGKALLKALDVAFGKAHELGGAEKAIIFTESRRTQEYLQRVLASSPYAGGIVLFNGTNTDPLSREIYARWIERHVGSDRVTGSRTADMRSALVDYFRDEGQIMIATEAGAEGINLQFCSLVVNYDLPWNPQRVEQRIGRCHRYGQKHDVVVVNFINRKNEADQRVYQLLSEKFRLFEGVFGASDEVLGAIESGVDFEKRIAGIYQECRQPEQIRAAFDQLQLELSLEIDAAMNQTRQKLLEKFDDEVREKLRIRDEDAKVHLDRYEQWLMRLTHHELDGLATFHNNSSFTLPARPGWANGAIPPGLYELPRRSGEAHTYRLNHPLGEAVVARAKERPLAPAEVHFDYANHSGKISILEPFIGNAGWLVASLMTVEALDEAEDHILLSGITDEGDLLAREVCDRLLTIHGTRGQDVSPDPGVMPRLEKSLSESQALIRRAVSERNARFFEAEADKLDGWADDLKVGLEREIKEIDRLIKEARRAATTALTLEEKLMGQKQIKTLEAARNQKRRSLFDAQDQVDRQRAELIAQIESKLEQKVEVGPLFAIRWRIV
ncbi:DEAD/DEAH box helicase [Mesorhizobium sp. M1A.F.Ca.IN.020.06.1.1]|nr:MULTISPECIES: SNF2-related protein [unclassified Mesorhizobium]RUV05552.1 DEAD/DEAH box helicase [Mesorhizobium sp. M1A.F.Ca.IN.020.03.2.1]RUV87708.1 DEAD/DEAH box helicase [Mesorhizobium sp. M1A.F.Ca.IN.020.32.1.1]RUW07844.1 DEAD/DEAH box helicase [Mesorhizobium sp. M1A.F.Ca.IN.022.05.2.1]RUW37300.1 DEAD/DEAH box helicase [Mesorhizobium sp. M1A.F.Ca.IN.020.06.1.1]RWF80873.1 MAG: DEAD/DEAH box helicase [Mesorhizobium sp.]